MAWSGSPMAQTFPSGGTSCRTSRTCCSSTSWYSSMQTHRWLRRYRARSEGSDSSASAARMTRSSKSQRLRASMARSYASNASPGPPSAAGVPVRLAWEMAERRPRAFLSETSSASRSNSSRSASDATRKPRCRPAAFQCSRRMERPREWKVCSGTCPQASGSRMRRRSRISPAALRVKVTARQRAGGTAWCATRCARRWVKVLVFPEPGPATTSSGPLTASTARR